MKNQGIYISKGGETWWKLIFRAFCFTLFIYLIYESYVFYSATEEFDTSKAVFATFLIASPLIIIGIVFSMVKDFHFDFEKKKYKVVKRVGPIGFGKWRGFNSLNYLSVYENLDGLYELSLWYNENKHYSIDVFKEKTDAIAVGQDLAKNLSIYLNTPNIDFVFNEEENATVEIPEDQRRVDAHITEGRRPIWRILIATLLYIGTLISLYFFYKTISIDLENRRLTAYFYILEITAILFSIGVSLSVIRDYQFDFKNNQYKIIHRLGPIKIGQWRTIKSLDYISVFKKSESKHLVNVWYNTNKHFNISIHNNAKAALYAGTQLAKKLNIDLLDATDPHNQKWNDI